MEVFRTVIIGLAVLGAIAGSAIGGLALAHNIDRWERANGYPYGKLCDVYRNCR
jgi:hypothetical protein